MATKEDQKESAPAGQDPAATDDSTPPAVAAEEPENPVAAAAAAAAAEAEVIYVMPQEQIDYILSCDYGKKDRFPRYDPEIDDEGGFDSAEWNKACDSIFQKELKLMEYQAQVRHEYESYGHVRVDPAKYGDEYENRMAEKSKADFLELFGPDPCFDCSDSDDDAPGGFQELIFDDFEDA